MALRLTSAQGARVAAKAPVVAQPRAFMVWQPVNNK